MSLGSRLAYFCCLLVLFRVGIKCSGSCPSSHAVPTSLSQLLLLHRLSAYPPSRFHQLQSSLIQAFIKCASCVHIMHASCNWTHTATPCQRFICICEIKYILDYSWQHYLNSNTKWLNKLWCLHTIDYSAAVPKKKKKGKNLRIIYLNEKAKSRAFSRQYFAHMCG